MNSNPGILIFFIVTKLPEIEQKEELGTLSVCFRRQPMGSNGV